MTAGEDDVDHQEWSECVEASMMAAAGAQGV